MTDWKDKKKGVAQNFWLGTKRVGTPVSATCNSRPDDNGILKMAPRIFTLGLGHLQY